MFLKIVYFEVYHYLHVIVCIAIFPILFLIGLVYKIFKELRNIFASKDIHDQIAVITGSGRGLGRDIAKELAARGCHIAVVDVQEKLALETAEYLINTYGIKARAYKVDIRDYDSLLQLREYITADLGVPTILINNAAVVVSSSIKNPPPQEVKEMVEVNFTALCYILQIFLPKMKEINRGYIVNIGSVSSLFTLPLLDVYCATKSAIRTLTQSLRIELLLERKNISATIVMPTFLSTNKRIEATTNLVGLTNLFPLMEGEVVAKYVVNAMLNRSREITVPHAFLTLYQIAEYLPTFAKELMLAVLLCWRYKTALNSNKISKILEKSDMNA